MQQSKYVNLDILTDFIDTDIYKYLKILHEKSL